MEPLFTQNFEINDNVVDRYGRLTPSKILFLAQEIAGLHCNLLSVDYDTLARQRMFWAVTRHRVQVTRLPLRGETIRVETWPMPTTRTAYPRAAVAYDADGRELFRSVSLWVLMDAHQRTMVLPGKSSVTVDGTLRGDELAVPGSIVPKVFSKQERRTVRFSDLDWVADTLPSAFHETHSAREFTVCYLSEAREGEEMNISWELTEDGCLCVEAGRQEGSVSTGHGRVFSARVLF